jgi:hypothetical protein
MEGSMAENHVERAADEYFNLIIASPMATRPEFLTRIIERLGLHYDRMITLRGEEVVFHDLLPGVQVFGQPNASVRFAHDRFYIVQSPVPEAANMDDPKVTTLRATPAELLKFIRKGSAKTEDFHLKVCKGTGVIPVACVEINVIGQNDTTMKFPVKIPKSVLVTTLRNLVESDKN